MVRVYRKGYLKLPLDGCEVREQAPYVEDIPDVPVSNEMLKLATHIIEQKAAHLEPEKFENSFNRREPIATLRVVYPGRSGSYCV